MGRDKALLPWGSGTLLDHTLGRLEDVTPEVVLLTGSERRYSDARRVVTDARPGAGPLSALAAALAASERPLGLFLGVDLPLVPSALLAELVELSRGWDAAVPVRPAGPEPLCAVYSRSCLAPILRHLDAGERKMTSFWADVRVRRVDPGLLEGFGRVDPFLNVNTRADYERALRAAGLSG
jgi:molybdenum cofactor guanylyltransferase